MSLHIETGHRLTDDVKKLDEAAVRFVTPDGRTMFEVCVGPDGRSIEVRGVENAVVNKVMYSNMLEIHPHFCNNITVSVRPL